MMVGTAVQGKQLGKQEDDGEGRRGVLSEPDATAKYSTPVRASGTSRGKGGAVFLVLGGAFETLTLQHTQGSLGRS